MSRCLYTLIAACTLGLALAGCEPAVFVRGTIVDIVGETLPGVAVTVRGSGLQDVTDIHGIYELRMPPGAADLDLTKTGYAPGMLSVEAPQHGALELPETLLWPLPESQGVYLFENFRYQPLTRIEPKRYLTVEKEADLFGTRKDATVFTRQNRHIIIAYKMFPYDIQMHRLQKAEAIEPQDQRAGYTWQIWAPVDKLQVIPIPVDEPEHLLLELQLQAPLDPGTYAVSWGALEGHTSTDPRIFLFTLLAEEEEAPTEEDLVTEEPVLEEGEAIYSDEPVDDSTGF
ncbi:MAG: carboxypeptidase-like regulatory domain-containing protein [Candidatus Hydrogenedentes bacterium]|nr:carboxypeptidase-like regulatory domain-containing protein [Candidatus Hydrogenedentota bacterium]